MVAHGDGMVSRSSGSVKSSIKSPQEGSIFCHPQLLFSAFSALPPSSFQTNNPGGVMGRGRCQRRRRQRRHILTTRDNLIIPFFEPPECLESRRRVRIWKRGNSMPNRPTKRQKISAAADLIAAFKRVHKRRQRTKLTSGKRPFKGPSHFPSLSSRRQKKIQVGYFKKEVTNK